MTPFPEFSTFNPDVFIKKLTHQLNANLLNITAILQDEPSWETLILPLSRMEAQLEQLVAPLFHLNALHHSPALRACYTECIPHLTEYELNIHQNPVLFKAIETLSKQELTTEQKKIIQDQLNNFKQSGIHLPKKDQEKIKDIQEKLAIATQTFENHLLDHDEAYTLHLETEADLAGLPETLQHYAKSQAEKKGKPGWILNLSHSCYQAILTFSHHRWIREALYHAYVTRASDQSSLGNTFDNSMLIEEILQLRHEEALLLGFENFAQFSLSTKMLKRPEQVLQFLYDLIDRAYQPAQQELSQLTEYARTKKLPLPLEPWDIAYIAEQQKQSLFTLTDEIIRSYFPLPDVIDTLFSLLNTLFHLNFKPIKTDVWHPDVIVYAVHMNDELKGYIYFDPFSRAHKRSGAWMDTLQTRVLLEDGTEQLPMVSLICNFMAPAPDRASMLSHDEILTLFHEMGHCLHHLLTKINLFCASGVHGVEWDAVELPSQFLENWAWNKVVLHPLPDALFHELLKTKHFLSAMHLLRQVELALFDFELHLSDKPEQAKNLEQRIRLLREKTGLLPHPSYYRLAHSFSHIFAGGYAAGYYSYLWAEVLSTDAFARFEEEGLFNEAISQSFLTCILEMGSAQPMHVSFMSFRGRAPSLQPFLLHHGILS